MRFADLIDRLPSHVRGSGFEYDTETNELSITVSRTRTDRYSLVVLPWVPEPGLAVRLTKSSPGSDPEGDGYAVFVCDRHGHDSCDCKGFVFGRGKPCKHILAVQEMKRNGWV